MKDIGLGYIRLGQPATTLSGGGAEAEDMRRDDKPSRISCRCDPGKSDGKNNRVSSILDEPTIGLHFSV
jgi:excinuclease UvrABC ATPase subunit